MQVTDSRTQMMTFDPPKLDEGDMKVQLVRLAEQIGQLSDKLNQFITYVNGKLASIP